MLTHALHYVSVKIIFSSILLLARGVLKMFVQALEQVGQIK